MMNCESAKLDLVECARGNGFSDSGLPNSALRSHLATCPACRDRWEAERELTAHLRALRLAGDSASIEGSAWSKARLMREFDAARRRDRQVRWMWAMSSAAILVLSVVGVRDVWVRPSLVSATSAAVHAQAFPPHEYPQEGFTPAEEAGETGFIKVPFALPPAPGETFGIVRAQLDPADLARMGVTVDPGWTGAMQADILVGEDGLAQAVRLSSETREQN